MTNHHHPVETSWIQVSTGNGTMGAYRARPPGGKGPGLLVLQEIFGVNEHIQSVARQYALAGFDVLAPDLFWRQVEAVKLGYEGADRDQAFALMKTVQREEAMVDIQACIQRLHAEGAHRVGVVGYCMGGRFAYSAAALCQGVDAAVAYYGGGIATMLDLAGRIRCPLMFHHAGNDTSIPPVAVADIKAAMAISPAAATAVFHDYPGTQHGFNCWARSTYDPASASLAFGRSVGFLAQLF
jgi:carboxymethylenebutenolidase